MKKKPTFKRERELVAQGYKVIVGVDEAGAGALAGPLVAGAVSLPFNSRLGDLTDSKLLTEKKRNELFDLICERSYGWGIGIVTPEEIFDLGLRPANLLAMQRAVEQIEGADFVLVDAWTIKGLKIDQEGVIKGDQKIKSIAAASVIAKVTRDRMMEEYAQKFPEYAFHEHKGYGTKKHREAIEKHGPCKIHRLNYKIFQPKLV